MAESAHRFGSIAKFAQLALIVTLALIVLALIASVGMAVHSGLQVGLLAVIPWALAVVGELALAVWALVCHQLVRVIVANEFGIYDAGRRLERIETLMTSQAELTRELRDLACLSDKAKSLIYRDKELEAFRETINHDLIRQDYRAAEVLIDEIETKVGYEDEARRLREEVAAFREATIEEKMDAAIARIEGLIDHFDWERAWRETQRLTHLFSDNPRVAALPQRIHEARNRRKRNLLQAYGEAARKNDVERSIELLKKLDSYLTPQEGAALAESARGVFKARLSNLGVQFAIHVTEGAWDNAIAAGEEIIREFPNSRMATEVRSKMDSLRARAREGAPTS